MCCGASPFGPILPSAHAVEREYALIAALHPTGFPVARPYGLCEDPEVLGAPFYIMEMVEGRTLWDGALPGMAPADRTAHYEAIVDTLAAAARHRLRGGGAWRLWQAGQLFRAAGRALVEAISDEPDRRSARDGAVDRVPAAHRSGADANQHRPWRLPHRQHDLRARGVRRCSAVLDWELSTLGDPLADFSYFLMSWVTEPEGRSGVKGLTGPETGIPTIEQIVARYCAATGRDGVPDLELVFRL